MKSRIRFYNKRKTTQVKVANSKPIIIPYDPNKFKGLAVAKKLKLI